MTDAAGFKAGLDAFQQEVKAKALDLQRRMVAEVFAGVVQGTPVDTGHARQGWKIEANGAAATIVNIQFGDRVRVLNDVPYVEFLAKGSSKQAPPGWIQAVVDRVVAKYRGAA
ncbi:MAG: HK97 gp10 family phage protein [Planctomycetota bacterium]